MSLKNLKNYFSHVSKQFLLFLAIPVLALSPIHLTSAAEQVTIEGSIGVANKTNGHTKYSEAINAGYDDVVVVQIYYHNRELPTSGKIANNLRVKVDMPTTTGKAQTIKATISADNSNKIVDTATINLDRSDAKLEFIPGSVEWRHNDGGAGCETGMERAPKDCYETTVLGDQAVTGANGAVLENAKPCFAFEATLSFLARVKVPSINVNKTVRVKGTTEWKTENTARPGETLQYQMRVSNIGNQTLTNVLLGDNPPANVQYVANSTMLKNSNHPNGVKVDSNNITTGGINIGNIAPGGVTYVMFEAKIKDSFSQCGNWKLKNVAVVDSDQTGPYENYAYTNVNVTCTTAAEKEALCVDLDIVGTSGKLPKKVDFEAEFSSKNITVQGYTIDYGDGSTEQVTGTKASHTYREKGDFTARVVNIITSDGTKPVNDGCVSSIQVSSEPSLPEEEDEDKDKESPEQLPNTGVGGPLAGLLGSGFLGAGTRAWLSSRRKLYASLLDA